MHSNGCGRSRRVRRSSVSTRRHHSYPNRHRRPGGQLAKAARDPRTRGCLAGRGTARDLPHLSGSGCRACNRFDRLLVGGRFHLGNRARTRRLRLERRNGRRFRPRQRGSRPRPKQPQSAAPRLTASRWICDRQWQGDGRLTAGLPGRNPVERPSSQSGDRHRASKLSDAAVRTAANADGSARVAQSLLSHDVRTPGSHASAAERVRRAELARPRERTPAPRAAIASRRAKQLRRRPLSGGGRATVGRDRARSVPRVPHRRRARPSSAARRRD